MHEILSFVCRRMFAVAHGSSSTQDALYDGYGEGAPRGKGPDQGALQRRGNAYLQESFPKLSYIKSVRRI